MARSVLGVKFRIRSRGLLVRVAYDHPEGYVQNNSGIFRVVYQYKDHLGNVRLSYSDSNNDGAITASSEIVEESNYYPFGLKHKGYNNIVSSNGNSVAQKFKFNGIELEESLGLNLYEMDLRSYDPAIGRFTGIDPVTHHSMSTYTAFDNNPVFWADPSGANSDPGSGYRPYDPAKDKDFANRTGAITKNAGGGNGSGDPDPPILYNGPGAAVGENVSNLLDEVLIHAQGKTVSGSNKSFYSDGGMNYGLDAEGRIIGKYGKLGGALDIFKIGSTGSYEDGRMTGEIEATALEASFNARINFEGNKLGFGLDGNGTMWSAFAKSDLGAITNSNGNITGMITHVEAGAYALKGSYTPHINILGIKFGFTIGGSLGSAHIGGKGAVNLDPKNFEVTGMAHAGLGAGLKLGFTITNTKQKIYTGKK